MGVWTIVLLFALAAFCWIFGPQPRLKGPTSEPLPKPKITERVHPPQCEHVAKGRAVFQRISIKQIVAVPPSVAHDKSVFEGDTEICHVCAGQISSILRGPMNAR